MPRQAPGLQGPENLQPAAAPVDAFIAPVRRDGKARAMAQTASALAAFGANFSQFANVQISRDNAEEEQRILAEAHALAAKQDVNRKDFFKAIKRGEIAPSESPWFHLQVAKAFAKRQVNEAYAPALQTAFEEGNVNTLAEAQELIQGARAGFMEGLPEDARIRSVALTEFERPESAILAEAAHKRRQKLRSDRVAHTNAVIDSELDSIVEASDLLDIDGKPGTFAPQAFDGLQDWYDGAFADGIPTQELNQQLLAQVTRLAHTTQDLDVFQILDHIKTGPTKQGQKRKPFSSVRANQVAIRAQKDALLDDMYNRDVRSRRVEAEQRRKDVAEQLNRLSEAAQENPDDPFSTLRDALDPRFQNDHEVIEKAIRHKAMLDSQRTSDDEAEQAFLMEEMYLDAGHAFRHGEGIGQVLRRTGQLAADFGMDRKQTQALLTSVRAMGAAMASESDLDVHRALVLRSMDPNVDKRKLVIDTFAAVEADKMTRSDAGSIIHHAGMQRDKEFSVFSRESQRVLSEFNAAIESNINRLERGVDDEEIARLKNIGLAATRQFGDIFKELADEHPNDRQAVLTGLHEYLEGQLDRHGVIRPERINDKRTNDIQKARERVKLFRQRNTGEVEFGGVSDEVIKELVEKVQSGDAQAQRELAEWRAQPEVRVLKPGSNFLKELDEAATTVPVWGSTTRAVFAHVADELDLNEGDANALSNYAHHLRNKKAEGRAAWLRRDTEGDRLRAVLGARIKALSKFVSSPRFDRAVGLLRFEKPDPEQTKKFITLFEPDAFRPGSAKGFLDDRLGPSRTRAQQLAVDAGSISELGAGSNVHRRMILTAVRRHQNSLRMLRMLHGKTPDEVIADPQDAIQNWPWDQVPYFKSHEQLVQRKDDVMDAMKLDSNDRGLFLRLQKELITNTTGQLAE